MHRSFHNNLHTILTAIFGLADCTIASQSPAIHIPVILTT